MAVTDEEIQQLIDARGDSWEGRVALNGAAYTSPSGVRIIFDYEDVSRSVTLRGTVFGFPGVNNEYVQRKGYGSRHYPMRCYFWGPNHDEQATRFEAALLEDGIGVLEHPMYGTIPDVVPFGELSRADNLVTAANQSIVEITFWTTTGAIYPSTAPNAGNEVQSALAAFDAAAAENFDGSTDLSEESERANEKAGIRSLLDSVSASLQSVADSVQGVRNEFSDAQAAVNQGMDVLIGQPLLLARQIVDLIKAPARAVDGIQSRLDAYGRLADSIFASEQGQPAQALSIGSALGIRTSKIANDFHTADLFASSALSGSVTSSLAYRFTNKPEALRAADTIQAQWERYQAWRDAGLEAIEVLKLSSSQVDTGKAYQPLQESVALATGRLVQISFTLLPERRIVLDRPRTLIDLCAELYQDVSNNRLDFFISSNSLSGDEILEVPKGRQVVYYA
jgi:hypothetical protein